MEAMNTFRVDSDKLRYNVLCKKRKRGVILLGDFWRKSNPKGKEDTPHVRIFMEGNCT